MALLEMQSTETPTAEEQHQEMSCLVLKPILPFVPSPEQVILSSRSRSTHRTPLFTRYAGNPILSRKDWPYPVNSVFNAGATRLADGDTLLLCRVEERTGLSHLCAARSVNGIDGWRIDSRPTLMANPRDYPEEIWGIEDPRITYVPQLEQYVIAYTSFCEAAQEFHLHSQKTSRVLSDMA